MCLIGFSYIASSSVIAPILSVYLKDTANASIEMISMITATFFLASALAKLVLGVFAGGKKTIASLFIAFIIYSICPMIYPLTTDAVVLLILRAVQGFAYAFIGTAALILTAITVSSIERDRGVGTYTAFLSLGFLAGPLIITLSIPLFGVADSFHFAGIMGFIGVLASGFLYRKLSAIQESWQIVGVVVDRERLRRKISAILHDRMFAAAFISNFAFFFLFGIILTYFPLYARTKLGLTNEAVSSLFVLYYVATTATRFFVGRIVGGRKISKQTIAMVSTALIALFSLSLTIAPNSLILACFFALIGGVQGIIFPVGSMLIADHIQPSRNVLANSLYMMGVDIGQGIAPLITAIVVVQYGLGYSFLVSAAVAAAATALLIIILRVDTLANLLRKRFH